MTALNHLAPEPERDNEATNETSPLLAGTSTSSPDQQQSTTATPHHPKFLRVVVICIICVFVVEAGDYMLRAPYTRMLEDIICRAYYEAATPSISPPIPEDNCKIAPIQSKLAMLKGWDVTFSCIPGILLAVPYGFLGDKYGRKLVLLLALFGTVLGMIWVLVVCKFLLFRTEIGRY
jgi:hypothetical protein